VFILKFMHNLTSSTLSSPLEGGPRCVGGGAPFLKLRGYYPLEGHHKKMEAPLPWLQGGC
jgi:hypothetical protein